MVIFNKFSVYVNPNKDIKLPAVDKPPRLILDGISRIAFLSLLFSQQLLESVARTQYSQSSLILHLEQHDISFSNSVDPEYLVISTSLAPDPVIS